MENLLKETLDELASHGKNSKDVRWVGNHQFWTTWKNFEDIANIEYDDGYGAAQVAQDLMIVGHDWWLERAEYDGSEWWDFHTMPDKPLLMMKLQTVTGGMWNNLSELNEIKEEEID